MNPKKSSSVVTERVRARANHYIDTCKEYSTPYERERLIANWQKKHETAHTIVEDFRKRAVDPKGKKILEVGFGNGDYLVAFAKAGADVYGLEVNETLLSIAKESAEDANVPINAQLYDGAHFPYSNDFFDGIYAISVLEHVSDRRAVMREVARVLKPGGCLYLAYPNRWWPKETHSGYWFIGYLPRSLARVVLRVFNLNTVDELNLHFLDYGTLMALAQETGLRVRFETASGAPLRKIIKRALSLIGVHHSALLPHVMVVLDKKSN